MTKTRTGLVHNAKGEGFEEVSSKKIKPKVAPRAPNRAGTNSVSKSKDKDKKMDTPGKKKDEKEEVTITISTEDCLHCNQNVDEEEKALECDSCKKWAHLGNENGVQTAAGNTRLNQWSSEYLTTADGNDPTDTPK